MYFDAELSILEYNLIRDIEKLKRKHEITQRLLEIEYQGKISLAKIELINRRGKYLLQSNEELNKAANCLRSI